ncbi:hypothetical protein GMD88_03695 [Pseudoflavonifractor sp. BIOML-A6]|nr:MULTISPECIES: hypothetical protein [unclassified Pseudoflavonifractor]MTQ95404.1 hypothetical protein [Pseudoflavonifractor sp. BIOML-A16]MTR07288.1 hypothetical protein [Pseudoflavonifractor sp. BIOML-A15]MTR32416.1 hypothetical protein [Pseudoflavonifractor sp. BIOML-A14]MTR72768.1 hypothetical protein [Pseudoflavonifractor sp. BIOML-A18]MTS64334.1 hypothetical protein [Pseudoflavonifractor sp. BIOML-A5]MTS70162.1 hypothetical protein [Pseudoflavonifractor sp. BIOML-A8]MTS92423.1 hypoth
MITTRISKNNKPAGDILPAGLPFVILLASLLANMEKREFAKTFRKLPFSMLTTP